MWRTLKIACVNYPDCGRMKLERVTARLGLQERFDYLGDADALPRSDEAFDIVFVGLAKGAAGGLKAVRALRDASEDAVFILNGDCIGVDEVSVAINVARIDWILPKDYSDIELKEALTWAVRTLDERRKRREMQLGREVLRATRTPAAILDRNYRVVYANRAADALFAKGDPFRLTAATQLVCENTTSTKKFHDELSRSLHKHFELQESALMRVERERDRKPVIVISIPKRDRIDDLYTYHIVFNDLEDRDFAVAGDVAVALNLSAAEARLTHALARGLDLDQASAEINITVNTARGYLKSIFEKTGVTRQAELVRLALLALP